MAQHFVVKLSATFPERWTVELAFDSELPPLPRIEDPDELLAEFEAALDGVLPERSP